MKKSFKGAFYALKSYLKEGDTLITPTGELPESVKELDILIFFDQLSHWELPIRKEMTEDEKKLILEKLKIWLKEKKLKSDL